MVMGTILYLVDIFYFKKTILPLGFEQRSYNVIRSKVYYKENPVSSEIY